MKQSSVPIACFLLAAWSAVGALPPMQGSGLLLGELDIATGSLSRRSVDAQFQMETDALKELTGGLSVATGRDISRILPPRLLPSFPDREIGFPAKRVAWLMMDTLLELLEYQQGLSELLSSGSQSDELIAIQEVLAGVREDFCNWVTVATSDSSFVCSDDHLKRLKALVGSFANADTLYSSVGKYYGTDHCNSIPGLDSNACGSGTGPYVWVQGKLDDENQCVRQASIECLRCWFGLPSFSDEKYSHCPASAESSSQSLCDMCTA